MNQRSMGRRLASFLALCLLAGLAMGAGLMLMTLLGLEVLKRMVR